MSLTSHVLDARRGMPAAGVRLRLTDGSGAVLAEAVTDDDGRAPGLGAVDLPAGVYRLSFDTGAYFRECGIAGFYPEAVVCFEVTDAVAHHHVPLVLAPFAYSTYRGS